MAPAAARINWTSFANPDDVDRAIATLVAQMETDLLHVQGHTRWGREAQDWERHDRDPAYLLRGAELRTGEQWLSAAGGKEPLPTALHGEFLIAGRRAATRRQGLLSTGVIVALAVSVLLTTFALVQRSAAIDQKNTALSRELGAQAERKASRDPELSVLLASEAVKAQAGTESEDTLRAALVRSRVRAGHDLGSLLLTGSPDGTARVWRVDTGAQIRSVDHLPGHARILGETRAAWTSDGEYFVTEGIGSTTVSMWHAETGLRLVQALGARGSVRPGGHELVMSISTLAEVYRCDTCTGVAGLERLVAKRTTRRLTKEERVRYLPEAP